MEPFFAVLNADGHDQTQLFSAGAGEPGAGGHPPINYHAYAACGRGGFYRREKEIPESVRAVLVLLRRNGLETARKAVRALQKRGKQTFVSWKESGLHQVSEALNSPERYEKFRAVCLEARSYLSSTSEMVPLYEMAGCQRGEFIPTPYPVDFPAWDFSVPWTERKGIFVGTREFGVPSRNHLLALSMACRLGVPITVINTDGKAGKRLLGDISGELTVVPGPIDYADYLRLMARHRVVFQLDRSAVPGQVAGDALLCRLICAGGDGAVDRVAFGAFAGGVRAVAEVVEATKRLLQDDEFYCHEVTTSQRAAERELSFAAGSRRLEALIS